jgi:Golgi phosphoprotein 3 (GPP34)
VDILETITAGLAASCVDERGRLVEHPLLDCSCRAAMVADLVRMGRVHNDSDVIRIDQQPVGWRSLDSTVDLLARGEMTLDAWLLTGPIGLNDVVDGLVAEGVWRRKRRRLPGRSRYDTGRPRDRWGRTPERSRLQPAGAVPASPRDAAVLMLARAAGLGPPQQVGVDDVLPRTGDLRWFCELAWHTISQERARNLRAFGDMRAGRIVS